MYGKSRLLLNNDSRVLATQSKGNVVTGPMMSEKLTEE